MHQEEGHRRRPIPRNMQKMKVGVRPLDPELRERIQSRLLRAPVELAPPILDETLKVVDAGPEGPWVAWRGVGKSGSPETFAQVRNLAIRNLQSESLRHTVLLLIADGSGCCEAIRIDDFPLRSARSQREALSALAIRRRRLTRAPIPAHTLNRLGRGVANAEQHRNEKPAFCSCSVREVTSR